MPTQGPQNIFLKAIESLTDSAGFSRHVMETLRAKPGSEGFAYQVPLSGKGFGDSKGQGLRYTTMLLSSEPQTVPGKCIDDDYPLDDSPENVVKALKMQHDLCQLMVQALSEAEKAFDMGEVPIGAVLADPEGQVLAAAHNQPIALCDPTAHAEILAIRKACKRVGNYRLNGCVLVVTIEPCIMCMGAAIHARLKSVVFGARDEKGGAAGTLFNPGHDNRLNHRIEIVSGIMAENSRELMQSFFQTRRGKDQRTGFRRGTEVVVTGSTRNRLVP